METIYEAFTSGKEVRRKIGKLIKAMGPCDWVGSDIKFYAIDLMGETTFHKQYGEAFNDEDSLFVVPPDPRDEVIKAAEAWYDQIGVTYIQKHAAPIVLDLKAAIENYRKSKTQ